MNSTTNSVTTSESSWTTPTTQVSTQQWQSQEQYQQYYNYYQAMSQTPVATTASTTDPNVAYSQDYSKAWDEYYKAYYGQSYSVSAPPTQYPSSGYNYNQYSYPNLTAPPPAYQYESVSTPTTYQYSQPPTATVTSTYPYTSQSNGTQPTSTWVDPHSSVEKPAIYNSSQSYHQSLSYDDVESSFEKGNLNENELKNNDFENDSYLERYPPPQFDSGNKQGYGSRGTNYRGRGSNSENKNDNYRRPSQRQYDSNNQRGNFNDRLQNNNISQFDNDDYDYQNDYSNGRGHGQGHDSAPFKYPGGVGDFETNNKRFSTGEYKYGYSNNNSQNFDDQNWNENEYNQNSSWNNNVERGKEQWNNEDNSFYPNWKHQSKRPMMNYNTQEHCRPMPLMDIVVRPTIKSSIIMRRQALIDQWQNAVRDISNSNTSFQQYWSTIKSGLSSDMQKLLSPTFVTNNNVVYCELHLDDIFLVQSTGSNENTAVEEASKMMWEMLQDQLYVRTSSRSCTSDKVSVFCVSHSADDPVTIPPIINSYTGTSDMTTVKNETNDWQEQSQFTAVENKVVHNKTTSVNEVYDQSADSDDVGPPALTLSLQLPPFNLSDNDLFIVLDCGPTSKDQSILILNNTAKFNKISIEYKHEKPHNAPHISQCLITINGQQFQKSEARDYLVAKREAADKAVAMFKLNCVQIAFSSERATELVKADIVKSGLSIERSAGDWLKKKSTDDNDSIYKFGKSFSNIERDAISKMATNMNFGTTVDGKTSLLIFRQYPLEEMKKRLLNQGFCAQYRLIDKKSTGNKSV